MGRSEGGRRARLAGVGPHPRRRIRAGASARGLAGATPCRVRKCVRGPGIRGMAPSSEKRAAIPDEGAPAGPGQARPHGPGPRLKARRRHHLPQGAGGTASSRRRGRPVHAHGRRLGDLGAHGRGHRRRGARACPAAPYSIPTAARSTPPGCWPAGPTSTRPGSPSGAPAAAATAEPLSGTLKDGMHGLRRWAARDGARDTAIGCIERLHDRSRPHSTIGYGVPAEAVGALFERTRQTSGSAVSEPACMGRMAAWRGSGVLCPKS